MLADAAKVAVFATVAVVSLTGAVYTARRLFTSNEVVLTIYPDTDVEGWA
jgi:hypothetical protein